MSDNKTSSAPTGYTAGDIMIYRYQKEASRIDDHLRELIGKAPNPLNWSMFNAERSPTCKDSKPLAEESAEDVEGLI